VVVAGEHLTEATVRELAEFLGTDPLSQKFRRALEHGNTIMSLTTAATARPFAPR
jgi:hypothetical protein